MLTNPKDWPVDPAFGGIIEALAPQNIGPDLSRQVSKSEGGGRAPARACRVIEALYDPGVQVRVAYVLFDEDRDDLARAWPEGEVCYVRYPVRPPMSRRGAVCTTGGFDVEVYRFPNDRRLRGLRKFAGRGSAAAVWQRWINQDEPGLEIHPDTLRRSLIRYVPEQKWIVHLHARCRDAVAESETKRAVCVRSAGAESCKALYATLVALRRQRHRTPGLFRVPKPVALDAHLGLLATRWVWGDMLPDLLSQADPSDCLRHVAAGLHAFHQTKIPNAPVRGVAEIMRSARSAVADIAAAGDRLRPGLRSDFDGVLTRLADAAPSIESNRPCTIHADFHWKQLRGRADRLTILDLDRCCLGDPNSDVATFATQLGLMSGSIPTVSRTQASTWTREFLKCWEAVSETTLDLPRIRWFAAVEFLTLARGALRHLRPGWVQTAEAHVARALEAATMHDDLEVLVS